MKPILFEGNIFGYYIKIHAYTFFLFLGAITGFILTYYIGRKNRVEKKFILLVYLLSGIMVFVGARLLNVGLNYEYYMKNPFKIITLDRTGFSLYGGFIGASISAFFLCRKNNLSFLKMADIAAPGIGIGMALSRLGCFLSSCADSFPEDVANDGTLGHWAIFELFFIKQNCRNNPLVLETYLPSDVANPAVNFLIDFV